MCGPRRGHLAHHTERSYPIILKEREMCVVHGGGTSRIIIYEMVCAVNCRGTSRIILNEKYLRSTAKAPCASH